MAAGRNVKVKINAKNIPTDIIFPNSITGLISPMIKDKNAIPVVKAAKKVKQPKKTTSVVKASVPPIHTAKIKRKPN